VSQSLSGSTVQLGFVDEETGHYTAAEAGAGLVQTLSTISIGVARILPQDDGFANLKRRADSALYRAKAEGRNRVVGMHGASANQELGATAGTAATTGGGLASR